MKVKLFKMLWITILLLALNASDAVYKESGGSLVCECTTSACQASGERRCRTTSGLCFAQRLGRLVVRGCTAGRTPLLCENRPPAPLIPVHGGWPLLLCCARPLCNKRAVPSPPPWFKERVDRANFTTEDFEGLNTTTIDPPAESPNNLTSSTSSPHPLYTVRRRSSYLPQLVSPITLSVVGLGVIGLAVIGIVAAILLRKKEGRDYGALEHDPRQCDCGAVTPT